MFSAREQVQPINLWHTSRIRVSILVDMWKYGSLVPVLMTSFMDWTCKSCRMVWDLLPRHNSLWVSLLKMLISLTLSLSEHAFFLSSSSFWSSEQRWRSRKRWHMCCHVLFVWWCRGSCPKKKYSPVRSWNLQLIWIHYILLCSFINICATVKPQ